MRLCWIFLCAFAVSGQVRPNRLNNDDIAGIFTGLSQAAARVEPMLRQLRPNEWVTKGAPDTYVEQWNSALRELAGIESDMSALAGHPDQMTESMKALFRVQASHRLLQSLMGGLRKYQNPALADLIESAAAGDSADIERLQAYLLELAGDREQQFDTIDKEAQRCRGILSRQPASAVPVPQPVRRQ